MVDVFPAHGGGYHFSLNRISEEEMIERLDWLNLQLTALGEPAVSLNIRADVHWDDVDALARDLPQSVAHRVSTEQIPQ